MQSPERGDTLPPVRNHSSRVRLALRRLFILFYNIIMLQSSVMLPYGDTMSMESRALRHRLRRNGFTLVELLTVIAILAILAAVLIPTIGAVLDNARKSTAQSNLRQIALAYRTYATEGGRPRSINTESIYEWARILAQEVDFNDPRIYILGEDPLVEQETRPLPVAIAHPPEDGIGPWTLAPDFAGYPLSFAVATRVTSRANPSTTPIAWTRGLQLDGSWAGADSDQPGVYGSSGGHIAFLDGHVMWFRDLTEEGGRLTHFLTRHPTASIREALNSQAGGLDSHGRAF